MASVDWSTLYLGTIADLDTDEATLAGEGAAALVGTYGSAADPLSDNVVTLTTDSSDNGSIERDNIGSTDTITYPTSPSGPTTTTSVDSLYDVRILITLADGGEIQINSGASILQDTNGNLFLVIDEFIGDFIPQTFSQPIESIEVQAVTSDDRGSLSQGNYDGNSFASTSAGPTICFLEGTRILTPSGEVPVEDLRVGDMVMTLDDGPQQLLWINRREMHFSSDASKYKPYRVQPNTMGPGRPRRPLKVSRQHRLLMTRDEGDVLVPVTGLEKMPGVSQMRGCKRAVFFALLLPKHAVVIADGAYAESFYPGDMALRTLAVQDRRRLDVVLKAYGLGSCQDYGPPARQTLSRAEAIRCVGSVAGQV
ncbi:Hint domain-containing protein [Pseudooctadecabacter jejudonensis]|uniref:Hint domain-containing protein n=1 Tax=Pseudooctadecabacter jejudonensis TaxID=1391910 RepID=A0A1Y5RI40_9RHOB|nr:Hint domain-containing protein [Pseudooctadecabacter jejudonensis]SLN16799.1 hypothetical protein PSJ8397_00459 [Pseudooctadecabacter jejudonensis]